MEPNKDVGDVEKGRNGRCGRASTRLARRESGAHARDHDGCTRGRVENNLESQGEERSNT